MSFRRPRTRPTDSLQGEPPRDCECGCGGVGKVVDRDELVDYLESNTTADDLHELDACLDAQAAGDAALALAHYRRSLHVPGLPHEVMLSTLALLGPQTPPWAIGRWIIVQAWWRMLFDHDPRTDQAVRTSMATCYDVDGMDDEAIRQLGTLQVASDPVAMDIGLFHLGGLASSVEDRLTDQLAARAPDMSAWIAEPMKVYRLEAGGSPGVTVRDVKDDRARVVYDVYSLDGSAPGDHVIGRVVADGSGGEIFEARPLRIDPETADGIVRGDYGDVPGLCAGWVLDVGDAVAEGRMDVAPTRPSHVLCDRVVVPGSARAAHPGLVRLVQWSAEAPSYRRAISWRWK